MTSTASQIVDLSDGSQLFCEARTTMPGQFLATAVRTDRKGYPVQAGGGIGGSWVVVGHHAFLVFGSDLIPVDGVVFGDYPTPSDVLAPFITFFRDSAEETLRHSA